MPSLEHNAFVAMFRENPGLAPHLVASLFQVKVPAYASVVVGESALDQLVPVEFRADLVLQLRDERGALVLSIVLEVQREKDPRKRFTWPVYVAAVRAQTERPAVVLVVAPDGDVAAWAASAIDLGLDLATLRALVLGPAVVPEMTDPAVADKEPELAVIAAVAHGNGPNGLAVIAAAFGTLGRLDQEHAAVYFQIIYDALREPMRRALEGLIMERQTEGKATFPPFAQQLIDRGRVEGELKGELKGELRGELKGGLNARRSTLLRLLALAEIPIAENDRARIQACDEASTLDRWVDNVLGAKTAAEVLS